MKKLSFVTCNVASVTLLLLNCIIKIKILWDINYYRSEYQWTWVCLCWKYATRKLLEMKAITTITIQSAQVSCISGRRFSFCSFWSEDGKVLWDLHATASVALAAVAPPCLKYNYLFLICYLSTFVVVNEDYCLLWN